ncbi:Uncharacterized protein HZ326_1058 [Fusarium oxysporum f. sp. albedinis]|nr:Uncharacterized protein HZ326_1058 [Fusarium oxysporum f. sp. albedinis]
MAFWLFGGTKPKKSSKKSKKGTKTNKTIASSKPKITDPPNVFRPARPQIEPPPYPGNVPPCLSITASLPARWLSPSTAELQHSAGGDQQSLSPRLAAIAPQLVCFYSTASSRNAKLTPDPLIVIEPFHRLNGESRQGINSTTTLRRWAIGLAWMCADCSGNENTLFNCAIADQEPKTDQVDKGLGKVKNKEKSSCNVAASVVSGNYFSKVEQYANSKLPSTLPPLSLHMPTWPLLCLAAQYSQRVYERPRGTERDAHVSSDWLAGPRQTCIKSVSMDDMNTIVFAIRGTASFMDWAVNLNSAPISPLNFLDDPGNLCHAGFLSVAKKMVRPVAARLRQLLQEDPKRSTFSLLITGHSAGGAIAALLYSHMVAQTNAAESELNVLTNCFKRIHCVTFGAPPVSLLPLAKPDTHALRKSIFLSFVNEGDPVVRADKAYVKSLLDLLASPPPSQRKDTNKSRKKPTWNVPPCTLSNAGRIVVLRSGDLDAKPKDRKTVRERLDEGVVAVTCSEERLRSVIWGDPVCHLMSLYAARIEVLAVRSVTARR